MLLSRVKTFNLRFRSKYHARDPSVLPVPDANNPPLPKPPGVTIDARESAAFKELDEISLAFRQSFQTRNRR